MDVPDLTQRQFLLQACAAFGVCVFLDGRRLFVAYQPLLALFECGQWANQRQELQIREISPVQVPLVQLYTEDTTYLYNSCLVFSGGEETMIQ